MKTIVGLPLFVALVATACPVAAGSFKENVGTIGRMNGGGSGVGPRTPPPSSVIHEPTRRPSQNDRGNMKFDPHRNDAYGSSSAK